METWRRMLRAWVMVAVVVEGAWALTGAEGGR